MLNIVEQRRTILVIKGYSANIFIIRIKYHFIILKGIVEMGKKFFIALVVLALMVQAVLGVLIYNFVMILKML